MGIAIGAVVWLCLVIVPFVFREPRVGGTLGYLFTAACWVILALLLPRQPVVAVLVALICSRAAMVALAWIARPSVEVPAMQARVTNIRAVAAIVLGMGSIAFTGWPVMFPLLATVFVVIRVVLWFSYARLGGISSGSLGFVRQTLEVLTLFIARLPESYLFAA